MCRFFKKLRGCKLFPDLAPGRFCVQVTSRLFGVVLNRPIFRYSDGNQNSMRAIASELYGKKTEL